MSKRLQIQKHLGVLHEVGEIMAAMKNIALMETHKLARFLAHQHRVLVGIEAAAADFLAHYPDIAHPAAGALPGIVVAIGSQRGFCGDFNQSLAQAVRRQRAAGDASQVLAVGRRLASRLGGEQAVIPFDGPGVAEEVQPVLQRVMDALSDLQARAGKGGPLAVTVLAHSEGERGIGARSILPAPVPGGAPPRFPYPPRLNVAAPEFFAELARHYLWAQMHDVFYGSLMAENRRRLQHLEGAIERMEEKADDLQRRCNLLRQEEITEEIEVIMLSNDALQASLRAGRNRPGRAC
ncbi:MAG: putative synthase gamma subunit [Rhodocyclaceae bacterium]|nr:putative synthase gamma subunit [Rhodocyclaceae bacterium]